MGHLSFAVWGTSYGCHGTKLQAFATNFYVCKTKIEASRMKFDSGTKTAVVVYHLILIRIWIPIPILRVAVDADRRFV